MAWWWPFKRREVAQQAAQEFHDMLEEAMLRQDDLLAATEKLRESRNPRTRGKDDPHASDDAAEPPRPNPKARNV